MTVLVLRPLHKLQSSCAALRHAGVDCVGVGLMTLVPGPDDGISVQEIMQRAPLGVAIFTSAEAVQQLFVEHFTWPSQVQAFAVGETTAAKLNEYNVPCQVPLEHHSEGLLTLLESHNLHDTQVFILKGVGGRETLKQRLTPRALEVTEFCLYERQALAAPVNTDPWHEDQIQCIVATSGELMEAAFAQFDNAWLKKTPWLVVSQRLAVFAAKLGIEHIMQSAGAQDQQIIESLKSKMES